MPYSINLLILIPEVTCNILISLSLSLSPAQAQCPGTASREAAAVVSLLRGGIQSSALVSQRHAHPGTPRGAGALQAVRGPAQTGRAGQAHQTGGYGL